MSHPRNDLQTINRARGERKDWRHPRCCRCQRLLTYDAFNMVYDCTQDGCAASIREQHSGPGAPPISHGTEPAASSAAQTPRPSRRDGDGKGFHGVWIVTALVVGFVVGWFALFLLVAATGCGS